MGLSDRHMADVSSLYFQEQEQLQVSESDQPPFEQQKQVAFVYQYQLVA